MKPLVLRHIIIGLLLVTGIFHLLVAMVNAAPGMGTGLAVFGVIYFLLSFYVRRDVHAKAITKKNKHPGKYAIMLAMAACALGITLGGYSYIQNGGPLALPMMFAIDVVIIIAGAMWLLKTQVKT
ncbi:hypothetical protein [Hyphococcus lacteus]|uniref:DUF2178 domain-containing protein n=1 Tax=Hyphococcus lacteus TaxID=3143536 RepID=A0ABV3Z714_9PROT